MAFAPINQPPIEQPSQTRSGRRLGGDSRHFAGFGEVLGGMGEKRLKPSSRTWYDFKQSANISSLPEFCQSANISSLPEFGQSADSTSQVT